MWDTTALNLRLLTQRMTLRFVISQLPRESRQMFKKLWLTMLLAIIPTAAHAQGALLVVTKQSHALAIVDGATLQVLARVPIGEDPHEVIVGPDRKTAYISNYGEGTLHTLAVVDLPHQKPLPPIDLTPLRGPHGLTLHDETLWFTAEGSKALGTLNPATRQVETVLGTGQDKTHLVWVSKDGRKVVASNAGSGTMSVFDRIEVKPVTVPGAPSLPASYTALGWRHTLIPVGKAAEGFAVSPDEQELWVGNEDGTISIINLAAEKLEASLAADVRGANRLKFTTDGRLVLVTTHTGKDLVVIDAHTRKLLKRIPIEQHGASGIQVQPDGTRAFVACPRDHYVAVVDLHQLRMVAKIDAGREPDGLAWWTR
jgi:DNA-binding beta-propeller fold protein YncE